MQYKTKGEYEFAINALSGKLGEIKAAGMGHTDLAKEFEETINQFKDEANSLPGERLTVPKSQTWGQDGQATRVHNFSLKSPRDKKDYRSLFGSAGDYQWKAKSDSDNFFAAVLSGRHDPRLIRSGMSESVPSDGGFWVPSETAKQIHAVSLENELVMPRCFVQPMISNEITIPAMEIGDHGSSLYGGFTASYTAEAGTINVANPKARGMLLSTKKLTGLIRMSNELAADMPGGEGQIINLCGKGLGWYRDKAFLKGSGAGEPLGILNANCLIEVAPESGQTEPTIMYENLTKMMSRMYAGSFQNSVWICHQTTIPQLLQLSLSVGTGGAHIPVMSESNGQFTMLTRPCIFTEKTETLGSKGDILLVDFSAYCVGLRQGMRFDTSIHVGFQTDELYARLIERHDGQPLWSEALTLEDGTTTVSPFVCLGAR